MSKYVEFDIQTIKSLEILLAALAELGWHSGRVEVHDQPQSLFGFHGDVRPERANVIIRRNHTGIGSSNDIGFLKTAEGAYKPIVSDFDSSLTSYGTRGGGSFVNSIERTYGKVCGNKALTMFLETSVPFMKQRGIIPRHATGRTVPLGKITEIRVAY